MHSLPIRMWINQPSTGQPLHHLHGTNVLAIADGDGWVQLFFLSGQTISMRANRLWVSHGWRDAA